MGQMRIFIASADKSFRLALLLLLDPEPDLVVVGLSDRVPGLLAQLNASEPDVLIFDWELSARLMQKIMEQIHNLANPPQVIILSSRVEIQQAISETYADLFIPKNAPPDQLIPMLNKLNLSTRDQRPRRNDHAK